MMVWVFYFVATSATLIRPRVCLLPAQNPIAPNLKMSSLGHERATDITRSRKSLSKSAARMEAKIVRDLARAMIGLNIPGTDSVIYAEGLAKRGVKEARELPSLDHRILDACGMQRAHRKLLAASSALLIEGALSVIHEDGSTRSETALEDEEEDNEAQVEEIRVDETLGGMRIDAALRTVFPSLSRSYFSELIAEQLVTLDGVPVKKSAKLETGSVLRVRFKPAADLQVTAEPISFDILHEDEHMIAVNKPAGMVVHPAPGHWSGTFVNGFVHRLEQQKLASGIGALPDEFGDALRPGIVHRLDRYTSGVLIAAKTTSAQRQLLEAFAGRRVFKARRRS